MRQLAECTGFSLAFACISPSPDSGGRDVSDNGLSSRMNVHVLNRYLLLPTFTAPVVQRR
jgi:hypothetical protein